MALGPRKPCLGASGKEGAGKAPRLPSPLPQALAQEAHLSLTRLCGLGAGETHSYFWCVN